MLQPNGQAGYPLHPIPARWQQRFRTLLGPTQLFPLVLGMLLLLASPLQHAVFKHDAYRSLALVCIIAVLARHYLVGEQCYRLPRLYVTSAAAFSTWGLLTASWASAWHQALLFALLPPLLFLSVPVLAVGWKTKPVAASIALALLALTLFSADALMTAASQVSGDTPYSMTWMSAVQAYIFYNSRDANQFHTLLIWSGLPCLWLAPQLASKPMQRWLLTGSGLAIPALGLFLILNSQGRSALLAVLAGTLTSALVLRGTWRPVLALFVVGLGLGDVGFALAHAHAGTAVVGEVVGRSLGEINTHETGRLHNWGKYLESIQRHGLWQGAGYRAIPAGSRLCDPHNLVLALGFWVGMPGLLLIGTWVGSLNWRISRHADSVQALLPGTFASLATYQMVDPIWGFAPSFALLCLLFGMVCPLVNAQDPRWQRAVPLSKGLALAGITLASAFFVLAQQPGFNAGHPALKRCPMGFTATKTRTNGGAAKPIHSTRIQQDQ